tara:strand:+ start:1278 stop:3098 length:1821 start_codon:yes stop_codon:yes gene_type:complete
MYNQIMQRPMFQTPQQRQGMGIMAGVAPVRGYEEGGMAAPEYTPKFMREEEPSFFSLEQTEQGSGINLRDLTDLLIVDPEDPIDVAMTTAAAGLIAFPPAAALTAMARMGYKGTKLVDKMRKLSEVQKALKSADKLNPTMDPSSQGIVGLKEASKALGKVEGARIAALPAQEVRDSAGNYDMTQGYANGGIASLPIMEMRLGGEVLKGLFDFVTTYGSRGLEALGEGVKRQLSKGQAEQIVDQAKKADKVLGEAGAETVEQGQRLVLKKPDGELIETPIGKVPKAPEPPVTPKVADEVTEAAEEAAKKKPSVGRQVATGTGKAAGIAGGLGVASDIGLGTNFISTGLEKIGDAYGTVRDDVAATLAMPEIDALRQRANPAESPFYTGERVELTESAQARLPEVETARKEGFPEPPAAAPATGQEKVETGTPKPEATGIMKFLFGKDGIGGEPGAAGRLLEKTQDPRLQYALAVAGAPSEGRTPRNFMSDLVLAGQEYDEKQAKIKSLEGDDTTALMQNYEFLKQAGKSDDEIFDLLLSKDTASDQAERYQDQVLSLFNAARKDPNNTGRSTAELLEEARSTAAAIILNQSVATPTDSEAIETVDLE